MRKWLFLNYALLLICLYLYIPAGLGIACIGIVIFLICPIIHSGKVLFLLIKKPFLKRKGS